MRVSATGVERKTEEERTLRPVCYGASRDEEGWRMRHLAAVTASPLASFLSLFSSSVFSGFNHPLASSAEAMAVRAMLASLRLVANLRNWTSGTFHFRPCKFLPCSLSGISTRFHAVQVAVATIHGILFFAPSRYFDFPLFTKGFSFTSATNFYRYRTDRLRLRIFYNLRIWCLETNVSHEEHSIGIFVTSWKITIEGRSQCCLILWLSSQLALDGEI